MNIVENSKQYEYLMAIRNIGMAIVFRKANPEMLREAFAEYDQYFEDKAKLYDYIDSLQKIYIKMAANQCTPDDVLLEMGQYTPYIIYDDEVEDEAQTSFDDSWLYD